MPESHLMRLSSKDEDVVVANFLCDLDVGTIQGPDDQRTIHSELHVASS